MQATYLKKFAFFFHPIHMKFILIAFQSNKKIYKTLTISRLYLQKSNIIRIFNLPTLQKNLNFCTLIQTCGPKIFTQNLQ